MWSDSKDDGLTIEHQFKLSNTVPSISCHSHFVAMGSTSVQLTNTENFEWRRTVADDSHEDESLEVIEWDRLTRRCVTNVVGRGLDIIFVRAVPIVHSFKA